MKGKDPRDAHFITSRICGICGDNHAHLRDLRAKHGIRVRPPDHRGMDRQSRRAAEYMFDHNIFQDNLVVLISASRW